MACVLVTGGTGLVGKHAVAALVNQKHDVHVLTRKMPDMPTEDVHYHIGDLLDPAFVSACLQDLHPSHLLHLAWITEHGQFWNAPENDDWVVASKHLIEAFQASGGQRVVVSGSCAEYDWSDLGDGVCREDVTPLKPHTLYGQCKVELFSWLSTTSLSQAWGRVFLPFGLGEDTKRLVPSVALALLAGQEARCSSGVQVRDFMHARDVGRAFAALLLSPVDGAVNIASGAPHAIADIANTLGELSGHPEWVRLGALDDRPNDPPVLVADVTRLRQEVGFAPSLSLKEGLREVYLQLKAAETERGQSAG